MIKILSRGKELEIPGYIDELDPDQYRRLLWLYMAHLNGMMPDEIRRRWLSFLIGLDDYRILLPEYVAELEEALPLLDDFFDTDGAPSLLTTRNLLPEEGGWRGPGDWLHGVSFGDFVEALTVMEMIEDDNWEQGARHVARLLYHIPEGMEVPDLLLIHAPRLVANVWRALQEAPVMINGRPIDFRIIFRSEGGDSAPDDKTGWTGISFELAEKGIFGKLDEVEKTDLWSVLLYLYKCKFEYINEKNRQD